MIELAKKHPDWELGFGDEVWWSRLSQSQMHAWSDGDPLRLEQLQAEKTDPDPKAIAWCGTTPLGTPRKKCGNGLGRTFCQRQAIRRCAPTSLPLAGQKSLA